MSTRKYDTEYIKYGFVSVLHRGECLPQCVIYMKTLSNSAMKPSLLKRHLESNHSNKKDRDKSYFQRLGENVKKQHLDQTGQSYQKSAEILHASYEVFLLIAKNIKLTLFPKILFYQQQKYLYGTSLEKRRLKS